MDVMDVLNNFKKNPAGLSEVNVAIDLGSDTVKITYAYKNGANITYGKLAGSNGTYPAWAYYDDLNDVWSFGNSAIKLDGNGSFKNLVKIKTLLLLLQNISDEHHYYKEQFFPTFVFPNRIAKDTPFSTLVDEKLVFKTKDTTPQAVCQAFFKTMFTEEIFPNLQTIKGFNAKTTKINFIALYPAIASDKYISELQRLVYDVACSFGKEYKIAALDKLSEIKMFSASKGTALYAYKIGAIDKNDNVLIFNIGEMDISVTKVSVRSKGKSVCLEVDGADAHKEPMELGGNDIDAMINDMITDKLIAENSESEEFIEEGTYRQQYALMRTIKKIKRYFIDEIYESVFKDGVPFSVVRGYNHDVVLKRDEFLENLTKSNDSIGAKLVDYVLEELVVDKKHNQSEGKVANKVLFVGGSMETYGLKEYIISKIKGKGVTSINLDDYADDGGDISVTENDVYASSVGGALRGTKFVELTSIIRKYYGTWVTTAADNYSCKVFAPFDHAEKNGVVTRGKGMRPGEEIPEGGARYYTYANFPAHVPDDEMFSLDVFNGEVKVGDRGTAIRKQAEKIHDLKVLSQGVIRIKPAPTQKIRCKEGVFVNEDGRATPFVISDESKYQVTTEFTRFSIY